MSLHAHASGIRKIAKYGSHAALVMTPKAPWPMKQAATAMRRVQCNIAEVVEPINSSRSIMSSSPPPPDRGAPCGRRSEERRVGKNVGGGEGTGKCRTNDARWDVKW